MLLSSLLLAVQAAQPASEAVFEMDSLVVRVANGFVHSLRSTQGQEYHPQGEKGPVLSLRIGGQYRFPTSMVWNPSRSSMRLAFDGGIKADIRVENKRTHLVWELAALNPKRNVELVVWGPFPTTIRESIGETVGVVRDGTYALGIQALNAKTLGGFPQTEDDVEPSYDIFSTGSLADVSGEMKELSRGDTARATTFGSTLQAYTRDRSVPRVIENWGHKRYVAPPFRDGGVIGSKIALFGCGREEALDRIGQIEVAEGLPHPMLDGVWAKKAPGATASYLIIGFGEKNLDAALALTKKAGLSYLYTDSCFENWGHFKLKPDLFPGGWASMRRCVEQAQRQGVRLGVHTLSNFITPNDPYVTPVPDKRLALVGTSRLSRGVDAAATAIPIEEPGFFNQMENNSLKTIRIGNELVKYQTVSSQSPWVLEGCERGAFGTKASAHRKGTEVGKLMDHGYNVFLTNAELSLEVSRTIARFFNETGLRQISFDGLEGNWSTGMGQYGRTLFTKAWNDALSPELRGQVINDASNPGHFNWHINTRMNWGEPWYAGFRESQTQYRLLNQRYYERNLMPKMLGWFSMSRETSIEDAEWLLARAAGFDAGFCLVTSPDVVRENGDGEKVMAAISEWERARSSGAFSQEQKARLRRLANEFLLAPRGDKEWELVPVSSVKGSFGAIDFESSFDPQPLQWIVQVPAGAKLDGLSFVLGGATSSLAGPFVGPCRFRYRGQGEVEVLDGNLQVVRRLPFSGPDISQGKHSVQVVGTFGSGQPGDVKVELRLVGPPEKVVAP